MVQVDPKIQKKEGYLLNPQRNYNEIVAFLDAHWVPTDNLSAVTQLDASFNSPSQQIITALISGTSGKSTTIHFAEKLLIEEGLTVGAFYTPHTTFYNERIRINNESISNKNFVDIANEVIQVAEEKNIKASTKDILTVMALLYFKNNKVDFALFENSETYQLDSTLFLNAKIHAITRIVPNTKQDDAHAAITNSMQSVSAQTHFVSADQNKLNLQIMHQVSEKKGALWSMPIRKLAPLQYPFEQLHGRCAALAERIAHIYIDNFLTSNKSFSKDSLLSKPKGQRGRPTLEAKKEAELHPKKTIEQFWNEASTTLPSRFQLFDKEKPTILLDNADNLDAFTNLFLGIRLLHYKKPFKGLALIIGCHENQFEEEEFIKQIRYFFKKTSGTIALCPLKKTFGEKSKPSWNTQRITNAAKSVKIKAKAFKSFEEAFDVVKKSVDDRNGLVVVTGSQAIISEYLQYNEAKKV